MKSCSFKHSSRSRLLKLSMKAFRIGLPGAMWCSRTPRSTAHRSIANETITNLFNYVVEYAHGGESPIKTLGTDGPGVGCAIDPVTGNLAVVNFEAGKGSDIQVWENASGTPTTAA
jgi:hypothetical protein